MRGWPRYAQYKASGVEWLGDVPEHWEILKTRHVFDFSKGLTITKENLQDEGIPCVSYGEIHSKYGFEVIPEKNLLKCVAEKYLETGENSLLNYGDFIFADTSEDVQGSGNFSHLNSHILTFAGYHTIIARLKKNYHHRYFAYLFDSGIYRTQIRKAIKGVKVFSITQAILKDTYVWLPTLEEQAAIIQFLDPKTAQIDALIAKKQQLLEKLAEQRTALISHAVTKGLDPNAPMKDSGVAWLGEVPEHWERMLLVRGVSGFEQGWSPSCDERQASLDEWGVLKSGCVNYGVFQESMHKTLPSGVDPIRSLEVKSGDVLMCRASGSKHLIGSVALVKKCRQRLIFSDKTYRINLNTKMIDPDFFVLAMRSKYMRDQIELSISGADGLANNIPQSAVKSYQFVLPKILEQKEIVGFIQKKVEYMDIQEKKVLEVIDKLKEYRAALITQAVTGQIDVRGLIEGTHP